MQTIWMTGMSQAGKTTLANALERVMIARGLQVEVFDGDQTRSKIPTGFDRESISKHLKRLAVQCSYMNKNGIYVIASVISPLDDLRQECREIISKERFSLVFVDTPPEQCAVNDRKGLWKLAQEGKITNLAGYDAPFEKPDITQPHVIHSPWPRDARAEARRIFEIVEAHRKRPSSLFIGRWQPFHNGHAHIIKDALEEGKRVVIAVRDTPLNESNPYPFEIVKKCLWQTYGNQVEVMSMPDIESINIGRNVGYAVNEVQVPEDIKGISATGIRAAMAAGDESWKENVPVGVATVLENLVA